MGFDPLADFYGVLVEFAGDLGGICALVAFFLDDEEDLDFELVVGQWGETVGGFDLGGGGTACDFAELHLEVGYDGPGFFELLPEFFFGLVLESCEAFGEGCDFFVGGWWLHGRGCVLDYFNGCLLIPLLLTLRVIDFGTF